MRVTANMTMRNYTKSLHTNSALLTKYSNQIISGKRNTTMSDDTASGVRALQVQRNLSRISAYQDNTSAADSYYTAAESTLLQLNELNASVSERFSQAITGTSGPDERNVVATELESLREELLHLLNGQFSDRYMFGGTNTVTAPFTVDYKGNLLYNGVDVSTIDANHPLMNDVAYVDLGLGLRFTDEGDPQKVDENSAFPVTLNGLDFIGYGSDNLYSQLSEMIDILRADDFDLDAANSVGTRFKESATKVNLQITEIGAKTQFLEFTTKRLETEKINLKERLSIIEGVDAEEAITNFKIQEYVYNAALQIGQRLLQPTLFSFIS